MTAAASAAELPAARAKLSEDTGAPPPKLAFADFHAHTRFSRDSRLTEDALLHAAVQRGLTHICVTDHNTVDGAIAVRDRAREMGLDDRITVIVGEEVSTADGEMIGIFLERTIPRGLSANATADEIHAQGGLVSIPHPYDPFRVHHMTEGPMRTLAEQAKIDAIEIFNSRVTFQRHNLAAAEFAARYGIPGIACSDSHSALEVAMSFNALPAFTTAAELRAALSENDWHGSRSTVLIHLTTRWAVLRNRLDRWRSRDRRASTAADR